MSKIRVTCTECGYIGFVDSVSQIKYAGWLQLSKEALTGTCPACQTGPIKGAIPVTYVDVTSKRPD